MELRVAVKLLSEHLHQADKSGVTCGEALERILRMESGVRLYRALEVIEREPLQVWLRYPKLYRLVESIDARAR